MTLEHSPVSQQGPVQVFVSSTSVDLRRYRARVVQMVEAWEQHAIVMDRFALSHDGDAASVSLERIASADLYLLLLAWRYGYVPSGQGLSITHLEYREARRLGKPCLAFLADPSTEHQDGPNALFPAAVRDPVHQEQLHIFRDEVQNHLVGFFTTAEDLVDRVGGALNRYLLRQQNASYLQRSPPVILPPEVTNFVGRGELITRVCDALRPEGRGGVAIALSGMAGVGKSALAHQALNLLARNEPALFPRGVAWVRCDGRVGADGLAWIYDQLIANWGGGAKQSDADQPSAQPSDLAAQERILRALLQAPQTPAEHLPALLLLDNVELYLPIDQAIDVLTPLGISVLITARHRLSSSNLRIFPVDVLDEQAAIALFAKRYQDRGGRWDPVRDVTATRLVVAALGYLPLAIELAASRAALTAADVASVAEELNRSDVLERLHDPINGSSSVRYSFEKSLALLTDPQRVRFSALGLPSGPDWPRVVIESMLNGVPPGAAKSPSASEDLDRFAALSLVGFSRSPAESYEMRVRVHPLLRDLAEDEWSHQPARVRRVAMEGLETGLSRWYMDNLNNVSALARDQDLVDTAVQRATSMDSADDQRTSSAAEQGRRSRTRTAFLRRLGERYSRRVEDALLGATLITPTLILTQPTDDSTIEVLIPASSVEEAYETAGGQLLILGQPGAGKTTLLLQLGLGLLRHAQTNDALPMPVICNLSSWSIKQLPFEQWLVDELINAYQVRSQQARVWVSTAAVLPLLDGLDEIPTAHQRSCIMMLNAFLAKRLSTSMVVVSRTAEYSNQQGQLALRAALTIRPLSDADIDSYLALAGVRFAGVRQAIAVDPELRELASSPYMLRLLTLTFGDASSESISEPVALGRRLFERALRASTNHSLNSMFSARPWQSGIAAKQDDTVLSADAEKAQRYLAWLAWQLGSRGMASFAPHDIRPDWLPNAYAHRRYRALCALELAGSVGMTFVVLSALVSTFFGLQAGLAVGIAAAIMVGILVARLLRNGAPLSHVTLLRVLRVADLVPAHYSQFLQLASEGAILQRVGDTYGFIHQLERDYFAALWPLTDKASS